MQGADFGIPEYWENYIKDIESYELITENFHFITDFTLLLKTLLLRIKLRREYSLLCTPKTHTETQGSKSIPGGFIDEIFGGQPTATQKKINERKVRNILRNRLDTFPEERDTTATLVGRVT